jgi:hypothetical protein
MTGPSTGIRAINTQMVFDSAGLLLARISYHAQIMRNMAKDDSRS